MKSPLRRGYHCKWCKGPGIIQPEDVGKAIRMPDNSLKCHVCQEEELRDRIVRVTPNSQRTKEILTEDKQKVDKHNQGASRINRNAGMLLMKKKEYRY